MRLFGPTPLRYTPGFRFEVVKNFLVVVRMLLDRMTVFGPLDGALLIPVVIAIIRPAGNIAARAQPVCLAELLGAGLLIVVRRAQGGETLERWKRLQRQTLLAAELGDRGAMVDRFRRLDLSLLQASLTARMLR